MKQIFLKLYVKILFKLAAVLETFIQFGFNSNPLIKTKSFILGESLRLSIQNNFVLPNGASQINL